VQSHRQIANCTVRKKASKWRSPETDIGVVVHPRRPIRGRRPRSGKARGSTKTRKVEVGPVSLVFIVKTQVKSHANTTALTT
jgi:hypothetical protein